ncbi:hypothetical protein LTR47_011901, partial [Exophiala xenobiotica]
AQRPSYQPGEAYAFVPKSAEFIHRVIDSKYIPPKSSELWKHQQEYRSGQRASNDGGFQNGRPLALNLASTGHNDETLDASDMIARVPQNNYAPVTSTQHEELAPVETLDAILSLIPVNTIVSAKLGETFADGLRSREFKLLLESLGEKKNASASSDRISNKKRPLGKY